MPTPLVALFYVWLLVSLVVLVGRLVRRGKRFETPMAPKEPYTPSPQSTPPPTAAADTWPTRPPEGPPFVSPPTATPPPPLPATPPQAPPQAPPQTSPPTSPRIPPGDRPTAVIDTLAGIALPCDLLPLTLVGGRTLSLREVLLITEGHSAEVVGAAMVAELERLGYQVSTMGGNGATAVRGPVHLRMTVHDRPDTILVGRVRAFPTAATDSVIVELTL